ncbi:hypothetical protein V3C99_014647 [Haemonchus contortus]
MVSATIDPQNHNGAVVAVIGCGLMGSGIAQVCLASGYSVNLYGRSDQTRVAAKDQIRRGLVKNASKKQGVEISPVDTVEKAVDCQMGQLKLCADIREAVSNALYIIEAVVEKKEVKDKIFTEAQNHCPQGALLVTNTSSISLVDLLPTIRDHSRFAGLHFFNPVPVMKLVEVVSTPETSKETQQKLMDFCKSLGKKPVSCKDTPGFIVNRLLIPYLLDSIRMLERGDATKEDIDDALRYGTSCPMGPIALCDYVGLDTLSNVMTVWRESMPDDTRFAPIPLLERLVHEGKLGRKTKEGFYKY